MSQVENKNRRPLVIRQRQWPLWLARSLVSFGFTANAISVLSVVFSILGWVCLMLLRKDELIGIWLWLGFALCIQCRLICNLVDGLIAVELKQKSKVGSLYNEVPDRISDAVFILGIGYVASPELSLWHASLASLVACMTAYIRVLGGSLGFAQDFRGPMAKQQRMFILTLLSVALAGLSFFRTVPISPFLLIQITLDIMILGGLITCWNRLRQTVGLLNG